MKKSYFLLLFFIGIKPIFAQVGINTTTPNAQLEIKSSDQAAPSNTDGILIPKVDVFPATNPTAAQQGMMVYLTTTSGTDLPGFYYWDNSGTPSWKPITGTNVGTLDQAYDFGGAGNGKTITADAGAVTINGTDGFVSTGTLDSGAIAPSGEGTRMVWNPRKAAFRAGYVLVNEWDNVNVGHFSTAFGAYTTASGYSSSAFGYNTTASGYNSTAFGSNSTASGGYSTVFGVSTDSTGSVSTAFGYNTTASGDVSLAYGQLTNASGELSTAFGLGTTASGKLSTSFGGSNTAKSYAETVFGIGATDYTPSTNGNNQFRTVNATDRLFVIGNAIDTNNNGAVDTSERSDALIILKNGLTRLPSTTNAMINAADGKAVVTKEYLQNTTGTLDQAYDFGGAGNGKIITADAGAVIIDGTDGFVSTGTFNSGVIAPSGAGVKMFWSPKNAAFRAGRVTGTQWNDVNIGSHSVAFGYNTEASGNSSAAFGNNTTASGSYSSAFGYGTTSSGSSSTAFGYSTTASGIHSTTFGFSTTSSGDISTAFGYNTEASGNYSTCFGHISYSLGFASTAFGSTTAYGSYSTSFGAGCMASGNYSTSFGHVNTALSYGETALGIGATLYIPSPNGSNQFRTTNATDRLLVVGNAIDTNNNDAVDTAERSDALVILKNGNTGIGSSTPSRKLQITENTASTTNGQLYIEQSGTGDAFMHFGNTGARHFNMGLDTSAESFKISTATTAPGAVSASTLITLQSTGEFGIGTVTPDRKLEVSGTGIGYARITSTGSSDVGIELKRSGSDWQMRNDTGDLVFAQSNDDLTTVTDVVRVGGGSFTPVTDNLIQLGQNSRRWLSVHAVNGVIQTSDATDKKEMLPLSYGLEKIKSLRPISFQWKDTKIDNSSTHLGFVAQEVQQVLPEVVVDHDWKEIPESQEKTWEKTEKLGMKYAEIIPVLVKAVQEQQIIIEELKARIEALEKK